MWSNIEAGILEMIISLLNLAEVACVASVCTPWRRIVKSFAIDNRLTVRHRSWVVISNRPHDRTVVLMNPLLRPTNPLSRRLCGAFGDWLVIMDMIDGVYLYHPLLHRVQLPPLTASPLNIPNNGFDPHTLQIGNYVHKVILSSPPNSAECLVAIIFDQARLAFCKLGDSRWTIYGPEDQSGGCCWRWEDAVFHNDRLVALDNQEYLWSFGFRLGKIDAEILFRPAGRCVVDWCNKRFLVESMGHLLKVLVRFKQDLSYGPDMPHMRWRIRDFKVFQMGMDGRGRIPLRTLGKRVMFLTQAMSTVVASDEIEKDLGSDCIYYAEAKKRAVSSPPDLVFYMAKKKLVQFPAHDEVGGRVPLFFSMFTNL